MACSPFEITGESAIKPLWHRGFEGFKVVAGNATESHREPEMAPRMALQNWPMGTATSAPIWVKRLRGVVRAAHGRGWILREHAGKRNSGERTGGRRTQITRCWADGSRSSVTVPIVWAASSAPALLATVERLKDLTEGQGLPLARAAELIQLQDHGGSAATVREAAVDWPAVVDRFREQLIQSGQIQPRTWQRRYRGHMDEVLAAMRGKRAPKSGMQLMEQLIKATASRNPPGQDGRSKRVSHVSGLLEFACEHCGAPDRFRPPSKQARKTLIGRKLEQKTPATPLLDDQALRVYRAIPDPKWRVAFGLMVTFGLRPAEIPLVRPDKGALLVPGVKRNQSGHSQDRLVKALDPQGAKGLGDELLAILEERGEEALPHRTVAAYWSTRMRDQLMKLPEWRAVIEEARTTGQGKIVVYSARHGYAHRGAMMYSLQPRVMAKLMGHTVTVHNNEYGRWASEQDVSAAVEAAVARVNSMQGEELMTA